MTECFCKGRVPDRDCYGRLTDHHIIDRHGIRRRWKSLMAAKRRGGPKPWSVTKALADPRNRAWACFGCHIGLLETGTVRVETSDIPEGFWQFVDEYDLWAELPRHLAAAEAA